jgi:hypothetical protein
LSLALRKEQRMWMFEENGWGEYFDQRIRNQQ